MSKPNAFEVGDVVYLKSGSPELTVSYIADGNDPYNVTVNWFVSDERVSEGTFPAACLTKTKPSVNE